MHFLGPRRHAAPDSRLRAAVRRLEHDRVDRRASGSALSQLLFLYAHGPVRPRRGREGAGAGRGKARTRSSGRCRRRRPTTRSKRRRSSSDRERRRRCRRPSPEASAPDADAGRRACARPTADGADAGVDRGGVLRRHHREQVHRRPRDRHRRASAPPCCSISSWPSGAICATGDERRASAMPAQRSATAAMNERAARQSPLLGKLCVFVIAMFGFGYALVPFYEKICEATGLRNIAQADAVKNTQVDATRDVRIEFDSNIRKLPWTVPRAHAGGRRASRRSAAGRCSRSSTRPTGR